MADPVNAHTETYTWNKGWGYKTTGYFNYHLSNNGADKVEYRKLLSKNTKTGAWAF